MLTDVSLFSRVGDAFSLKRDTTVRFGFSVPGWDSNTRLVTQIRTYTYDRANPLGGRQLQLLQHRYHNGTETLSE